MYPSFLARSIVPSKSQVRLIVLCLSVASALIGAATFVPDWTFRGSTLQGWHTLGQARWSAANGEVTGQATGNDGGWLVLDHSLQDLAFHASFRCDGDCKPGVLLRAEKTDTGMKGIYISLSPADAGNYSVTLDSSGRETSRERLPSGGGTSRIYSPQPGRGGAGGNAGKGGGGGGGRGAGPGRGAPPEIHPNEWNEVNLVLDANILRPYMTANAAFGGVVAEESAGKFGPIALHVAGSGQVHFKDIYWKSLNSRPAPAEEVSPNYRKQQISEFYYSWGVAVADINHDGIDDVIAGAFYYPGPKFDTAHEIYVSKAYSPSTEYPADSMIDFAHDFTGDGWPDVLNVGIVGAPAYLYVNPRGEDRRWDKFMVVPHVNLELALLRELDGDGKPEFIYGGDGILAYAKPDPANPTGPWKIFKVSGPGGGSGHGIGVGDINGDGRMDIVRPNGWYEQPEKIDPDKPWTFHSVNFAGTGDVPPGNFDGGAEMGVYDINGDGLVDVVTSMRAHGFGLAWFEQKKDSSGNRTFESHMIMDDFSTKNAGGVIFTELHGSAVADVDGDGIPDFIVGKRWGSHQDSYTDPYYNGPAVLYVYHTVRNKKAPGSAEFVPELIHNRSGAGNMVLVTDLNKDGAADILTSADRGTFIFWGTPRSQRGKKQ